MMAIEPAHHHFQREARIEAGGARIGAGEVFRPRGVFVNGGEFGGEEGELGHR